MKNSIDKKTGEITFYHPTLRAALDNHDEYSDLTGLKCEDESLASQSSKDEADINTLVRRFGLTGELPTNLRAPTYGDFTNIPTYQEALNALNSARDTFLQLPAEVREEFNNNPALFVDFCSDEKNLDRMHDLGLVSEEASKRRQDALQAKAKAELDAQVDSELQKRLKASKEA